MKQTLIVLLLLLPFGSYAQEEHTDTAAMVVDRYLSMLNIEGYSEDSMLVMETAITVYGSNDTLWMRRWFAPANKHRVEIWYKDSLTEGLIGNDEDVCMHYNASKKRWESIKPRTFFTLLSGYDFRGHLYHWRWNNTQLTWNGTTELKGEKLQVVKASRPGLYDRFYMFDPNNGLLTLIFETEDFDKSLTPQKEGHIEWKSFHEYLPVSNHLVPSSESFMRNGMLTILSTTAHLEPVKSRFFNHQ